MKCLEGIKMATNWIGVKYDEYDVLKRRWNNAEFDVFDIILKDFFYVKNAMFNSKMTLPSRVKIH